MVSMMSICEPRPGVFSRARSWVLLIGPRGVVREDKGKKEGRKGPL
jgi:hypothetical protein